MSVRLRKSVVIPCFNSANFVRELYSSIVSQSEQVDEIIFVDDGSSDSTRTILQEISSSPKPYGLTVNYFPSLFNTGMSSAINRCIAYSSGDVIFFTGHDDIWQVDRVSEAMSAHNRGYDFFHSNMEVFGGRTGTMRTNGNNLALRLHLLAENGVCGPSVSVLLGKNISRSCLYFNHIYNLAEDYELWTRLFSLNINIAHSQRELVKYRIHQKSISAMNLDRQRKVAEMVSETYASKVFPDLPPDLAAKIGKIFGSFRFQTKEYSKEEKNILGMVIKSIATFSISPPYHDLRTEVQKRISSVL